MCSLRLKGSKLLLLNPSLSELERSLKVNSPHSPMIMAGKRLAQNHSAYKEARLEVRVPLALLNAEPTTLRAVESLELTPGFLVKETWLSYAF